MISEVIKKAARKADSLSEKVREYGLRLIEFPVPVIPDSKNTCLLRTEVNCKTYGIRATRNAGLFDTVQKIFFTFPEANDRFAVFDQNITV
jgi:hypothetical protein